ncbi:Eukaryotic translation initiation factor 3 subunit M [Sphaceloma murrayae]|uniref:Eukaryotic translation initiation factor 3 subunit M n=1 Tax=Sphaceloma murrayae TaxID=2082308 RepID=A0A2K1R050_9PEZI|nr:Eukaryotic translation initiation factor 3 subunit M [Sphaceloma murrayae]
MGALKNLFPLVVLFTVIGIGSYFGYQIYTWSNEMADRGRRKMEKKNVVFTKDGVKVGVKELSAEEVSDRQQGYFVKAWNYSSMPAYKSMFWNKEEQARQKALAKQGKSSGAASGVSSPSVSRVNTGQQSLQSPGGSRPSVHRGASNPGAFPDS